MSDWKSMLGIGFTEFDPELVTFKLDPAIVRTDEGKVVKISADSTVGLCADADTFYGKLVKVDTAGDVGGVQDEDFMIVSYTGAPVLGYSFLVANATGGVRPKAGAEVGRPVNIVSIDSVAGTLVMDIR